MGANECLALSRFCTVLEYIEGRDLDFLLKQSKTLPEKEVSALWRAKVIRSIHIVSHRRGQLCSSVCLR